MVGIKDISKLSGYSKTTVSKVLNGYTDVSKTTREKILKICDEQGYIPSALGRNLSIKRTFTIGVVFSDLTNQGITHPFFSEMLNEFKNEVEKEGYDILLIGNKVGNYVHSYLSHCRQKAVDGIILLSAHSEEEGIKELVDSDIPMVAMQSYYDERACFVSDNKKAIREMLKHLVENGHKDIGFVYGDLETFDGKERYDAFKNGMKEFGLEINDNWIFNGSNYTVEDGRIACQQMLTQEKWPTAMMCASDTLAIGCMIEMYSNGYDVPKDLSVTGFDDIQISKLFKAGLTTIRQDKNMMVKHAVKSLIAQINGEKFEKGINVIPCGMEYRETVRKIEE